MRETDKILEKLEKEISVVYRHANFEVQKKIVADLEEYEHEIKKKNKQLKDGKITKDEFQRWKMAEITKMQGRIGLRESLAEEMTQANVTASGIINGTMPLVYAEGYNYGTYMVEKATQINTSFSLYNQETVMRLLKDDPDLLPKTKINIPKDKRWNKKHINSQILQGVLQGESMDDIATRLVKVVGMNHNSAIRNARTATTCAENRGNLDSYYRAQDLGIKVKKQWLATLDGRTRHTHRLVDGEVHNLDDEFSNGVIIPGEFGGSADESEIYNCRCTTIPYIEGFDNDISWKYDEYIEGESYEEWRGAHG